MQEVKIDKKFPGVVELLAKTFPNYKGRKFTLRLQDDISFNDINWDGGSRTEYFLVNTETLQVQKVANSQAPWTAYAMDAAQYRKLPANCIIVSQTCFAGKMLGIDFTIAKDSAPPEGSIEIALLTGNKKKNLTNLLQKLAP